jgi:hypothetical protein
MTAPSTQTATPHESVWTRLAQHLKRRREQKDLQRSLRRLKRARRSLERWLR